MLCVAMNTIIILALSYHLPSEVLFPPVIINIDSDEEDDDVFFESDFE